MKITAQSVAPYPRKRGFYSLGHHLPHSIFETHTFHRVVLPEVRIWVRQIEFPEGGETALLQYRVEFLDLREQVW